MTDLNMTADNLITDIAAGMDAAIAPVAKAAKPKTARKVKGDVVPVADPSEPVGKAEKPVAPAKPAPTMFMGFEVAEDADTTVLTNALASARESFSAIGRKDADLLSAYLDIGAFLSEVAPAFKSPKLFGQFVAKELPESAKLDPALRSNCKWVFEALNGIGDNTDLLVILGVNDLASFKSGNPTVIRREYKALKDAAQAKATLAANGIDPDDAEAVAEAAKASKAKTKADAEAQKQRALAAIAYFMTEMGLVAKKAAILERVGPMLTSALMGGAESVLAQLVIAHEEYLDEQDQEDQADE